MKHTNLYKKKGDKKYMTNKEICDLIEKVGSEFEKKADKIEEEFNEQVSGLSLLL